MPTKTFCPVLGVYGALWKLARPILRRHKRLRAGFDARLVPDAWPEPDKAPNGFNLWIQAASGGEAYLTWEILKALAAGGANIRVLCTSCTEQGLAILYKAKNALCAGNMNIAVNYLPLDEPALMRRAVNRVFPEGAGQKAALVLLETEIWPGLLAACREHGVPALLLNGRMTEKSRKSYNFIRGALKSVAPACILASTAADLERFKIIFSRAKDQSQGKPARTKFGLMPNIKFDRLSTGDTAQRNPLETFFDKTAPCPLLVLGSVRQEEEPELLPVIKEIMGNAPDVCIVLAPRHLYRVEPWLKRLETAGMRISRRSSLRKFMPGTVAVWDVFGELEYLYGLAAAAFVGGSLAPLGGHNFLEPLAHGLIPCTGPFWSNFYWVGQEIFDAGLAIQVKSASKLAQALLELLKSPRPKSEVRQMFSAYIASRTGGTGQAVQAIANILTL